MTPGRPGSRNSTAALTTASADLEPQRAMGAGGLTSWLVLRLGLDGSLSGFDPDPRERRFGRGLLCRHPTGGRVRLRGLAACPEAWFPQTVNRGSASAAAGCE